MAAGDSSVFNCKELSFCLKSFSHLNTWIEPLRRNKKQLITLRTSFSDNVAKFLRCPPIGDGNMDMTNPNNFGNVLMTMNINPGDATMKWNLLSRLAEKFEAKRCIFSEIESLEYGVNSIIANNRVDLILQLLKDLPAFHNDAQKLIIKRDRMTFNRTASFLELIWWVTVALFEDGPTHREFRVDKPALLSTLLLIEVLHECGIKTDLTVTYTLYSVGSKEDFNGNSVPMIVFDSTDLVAAVEEGIKAAWFSEGLVPWATTAILVQESIYSQFVSSFKKRLSKSAEEASLLFGRPNAENSTHKNMKKVLSAAKELDLHVFQVQRKGDDSIPATVVFGDFVSCQIDYTERDTTATLPMLFVVPFRTMDEGLSLANRSAEKIAASVWSESYTMCLSAVSQLSFGTIWINSHGIFDSRVPFFSQSAGCMPVRPTGIDFYHWSKSLQYLGVGSDHKQPDSNFSNAKLQKLLTAAYEAHLTWAQKNLQHRIKVLDEAWERSLKLSSSLPPSLKKQLTDTICGKIPSGDSFQVKNCLVSSVIEAVGIVLFILEKNSNFGPSKKEHLLKLILSAVFSKNAVIVLGSKIDFSALKSCLPQNVLNFMTAVPSKNLHETLRNHRLRGNVSVWKLEGDRATCTARWNGPGFRDCVFDIDFDSRTHMVRRKVVWMPLI